MKLCDFCSFAKIIMDYTAESKNVNQMDLVYDLFKDFIESDEGYDFEFDNGLVCRWLNGTAKLSPRITSYYAKNGNIEALAIDIEENILPLLYDKDMAVKEIYELFMNDSTVSESKKAEIANGYPYENATEVSDFLSRVLLFGLERPFVKRDAKTKAIMASGALSPLLQDYIYDGLVPKPCKHFCGRENELELLHSVLDNNGKVFVQGVPGIGKSEFVKMYAKKYKKDYTNILYFNYNGDLKQMITDCDFADDRSDEDYAMRFKRHNRFLRSLKEDTLIIIDNFNTIASNDALFDVVMSYRCKILFTTRSRFDDYTSFDLEELDEQSLLALVEHFYDEYDDINTVKPIIGEVHSHTLSVELAARLLASGILEPDELLKELKNTRSVLHTDDRINIVKDGKPSKATYYEHIHKLVSLFALSDQAVYIMRNMSLIPADGIRPKLFGKWICINDLNTVNELIEYGFIDMNERRKIFLHPIIQEIAVDDTNPSIKACPWLIKTLHGLCLFHGLDLPYHDTMFKTTENIITTAEKDDMDVYLSFIKDAFPYMEKYAYRYGMELIISELERYSCDAVEKAMLLDYKAAYEHICNNDHKKALRYEQQAVKYCDEIVDINPHLAANICGNTGGMYHSVGQVDKAKHYMERAYMILSDNDLEYTNDSVIQICNYANLLANTGEPQKAIRALKACAQAVKKYNSDTRSDYANLLWDIGGIYMQLYDRENALVYFKGAMKIYTELWQNEPELLQAKLIELQNMAAVYEMSGSLLLKG